MENGEQGWHGCVVTAAAVAWRAGLNVVGEVVNGARGEGGAWQRARTSVADSGGIVELGHGGGSCPRTIAISMNRWWMRRVRGQLARVTSPQGRDPEVTVPELVIPASPVANLTLLRRRDHHGTVAQDIVQSTQPLLEYVDS